MFGVASDTFTLNPVQRVALPYRFSITRWEVENLPDKWLHKLATLLPGIGKSEAQKLDDLRRYFHLRPDFLAANDALKRSTARPNANETASLQAELDRISAERAALRDGVEETIESGISTAIREMQLASWRTFVFPPVDIRLAGPPTILLTSPRDRIERRHQALLEPDISLEDRERLEDTLMAQYDVAAVSFQIGGLAAYPASVIDTLSLADTFRVGTHEWVHHYMVFHPLGQKMFTSPEMISLNETFADIVGRELGDRARELLLGAAGLPPRPAASPPSAARHLDEPDKPFDFNAEMRKTRLRVDELLRHGRIDDAEAYMEDRRLLFVENGFPIRKLNQAYFAFHGTYAENPASSSPVAGQLSRFRSMVPDLRTFIVEMADIASYSQFLQRLRDFERNVVP